LSGPLDRGPLNAHNVRLGYAPIFVTVLPGCGVLVRFRYRCRDYGPLTRSFLLSLRRPQSVSPWAGTCQTKTRQPGRPAS